MDTTTNAAPGGSLMRRLSVRFGPLARPLAGSPWFPLWAVLGHVGRRSGTPYETPIVARPTRDGFLIPLPFGDSTQWVQNLIAAGGGHVRQAGRTFAVDRPEIVSLDDAGRELSAPIRFASRRFGIRRYVRVRVVGPDRA
jgi:deazaflavin-dependent oxidoreductase (nitroreductase family)